MRSAALWALVFVWFTQAGPARPVGARELWHSGDARLEFSGSLRGLATYTKVTDASRFADAARGSVECLVAALFESCPAFDGVGDKDAFAGLSRLRLRFDLTLTPRLSATVVYDNEFRFGFLDRLAGELGVIDDDTFLGAEDEIHMFGLKDAANHRRWRHLLYRGFVHWESEHFHLSVGRLRIPWGVGRLWNPIDRFNAIPPLAIEQDQSQGIDGIDARWVLSGFSYLQAVYAPGTRSDDARYALRYQGVLRDVDVSLMAGVFEEARTFGGDLSGNLGDAAWRLEAVYTNPERKVWPIGADHPRELDRYWQIVVSLDRNFEVGSGLYFLVEHLYNGNAFGFGGGEPGNLLPFFESTDQAPSGAPPVPGPFVTPASAAIFGGSRVVSSARHTTGIQLGYDISSVLRGDLVALWDWNGSSMAIFPSLAMTGWNSVELSVGVQLFTGGAASQYGSAEPLAFILAEVFF